MPTHVALLRGINLAGRNRVAMADLRQIVTRLGHTDVSTYIQSGNVVFTASGDGRDHTAIADELAAAIADRLGVVSAVVVLRRDELAAVVDHNPFPDLADPRQLHAVFHGRPPSEDELAAILDAQRRSLDAGSPDEVKVVGQTVYLHTPDGLGRSKLAEQLNRGGGDHRGTARNWRTVTRLLAMLDG